MTNLVSFEGFNVEFLTKEDVNFDFNGEILFHGNQTTKLLEYTNAAKALNDHVEEELKYLVTKEKLNNEPLVSLGQRGNWFINEDGVFDLIYNSKLPKAKEFKKKIKHVIKQIQKTGRYDEHENQIETIEDEKEKFLRLKFHKTEETLKFDPSDLGSLVQYNSAKTALEAYLNTKEQVLALETKLEDKFEKTDKLLESASQLRDGDMSPEAIARELNIHSANSGRPHKMIGDTMAMVLGFYHHPDSKLNFKNEYVNIYADTRSGVTKYIPYYTKLALKEMKEFIEEKGLPLLYTVYKRGKDKDKVKEAWIDFRQWYKGSNYCNINIDEKTLNLYFKHAKLTDSK